MPSTKKQAVKKAAASKKSVKQVPAKKAVSRKQKDEELPVQHIHTGKAATLSKRSTLTFHVGVMDGATYIRVYSNSGGGMHSRIWMSVSDILATLEKQPKDKTVTSYALHKLFEGRSANDPSFMWAVILHLKLVQPDKEKKRQYRYDSPDAFLGQIDKIKTAKAGK